MVRNRGLSEYIKILKNSYWSQNVRFLTIFFKQSLN